LCFVQFNRSCAYRDRKLSVSLCVFVRRSDPYTLKVGIRRIITFSSLKVRASTLLCRNRLQ
jgi:hypothetical protein